MAYNIAALCGAAFAGKLKSFAECFPSDSEDEYVHPDGMTPEGAKILGALFKLKERGVAMTVEKISLH